MGTVQTTLLIAQQIVIMFLMMALGYVLVKKGFLTESFNQMLSKLLLNVVVPCLLIASFQMGYDSGMAVEILQVLALSVLVQVVCIGVGRVLYGQGGNDRTRLAKLGVGYCNCGFMGLPLLQAILGASGVVYASAFIIIFNLATWTHCYATVRGTPVFARGRPFYRALLVPSILAAAAGIALYFLPFRLPTVILTPLETVGVTNTPLAMLVLGGFLTRLDLRRAFLDAKALLSYAGRLILCPVVCGAALLVLPVTAEMQTAMFLISAMPASTSLGLQAELYGSDGAYGAQLVAMSTLLSAVTIPLLSALFFFVQSALCAG